MKNKKATYLLGFAVLVVWGLILYRVFHSANDTGQLQVGNAYTGPKESLNDYSILPDTTPLRLNYRDPFGSAAPPDTARKPIGKAAPLSLRLQPLPKPAQDWNFIRYSGFVRNPGSKRLIAMVNIRGKDLMMSEGETAEDVRLIKNLQDSIKVLYKGKAKIITINSGIIKGAL